MQITIAPRLVADENERIDAQFFHPAYVESYERTLAVPHDSLCDLTHVTDGNHLKIAECFDAQDGVRYLRGQDLSTDMMLHDRNVVYITEQLFDGLKRSHIFNGDVLVTIVGANTGLIGLVHEPPEKLVASCKLGIVRPGKSKILPGYLYAFLAGRFGQHQILRSIRGGGQTGLVLPDLRKLLINRISSGFEQKIHDLVVLGHIRMNEAKSVFKRANRFCWKSWGC